MSTSSSPTGGRSACSRPSAGDVQGGVEDTELLAELLRVAGQRVKHLLPAQAVDLDVHVLGGNDLPAGVREQRVTDGTTDDERPAPGGPEGIEHLTGFRCQDNQIGLCGIGRDATPRECRIASGGRAGSQWQAHAVARLDRRRS